MPDQIESGKTIVNSWNEWDPLKHVIVGRADGTMVQAPEPAMERDWPKHGFPLGTYGPLPKEMEAKANENLIISPNCWRAGESGWIGRHRWILASKFRRRTGNKNPCSAACHRETCF